jgi:protein-tyrosine phosphatase
LAVSAYPPDAAGLAELPLQAVLNVCDFGEPSYGRDLPPHARIVRWPFEDGWPVSLPWLTVAVLELADLRRRGIPTLVHCHLGRSRSPTVVALFWMARDGIDWRTAVTLLAARRPGQLRYDGRSPLVDASTRGRVVEIVRAFLRGEAERLEQLRRAADGFADACRRRAPDPAPRGADWNLIEEGLAVGESISAWPGLAARGFDTVLVVRASRDTPIGDPLPPEVQTAGYTFPVEEALNATVLREAVRQVEAWRQQGRGVFVLGPGEDFFAVVTTCIWLMEARAWDAASAIWYVGSRRPSIGRFLGLLAEVNLESLAARRRVGPPVNCFQ